MKVAIGTSRTVCQPVLSEGWPELRRRSVLGNRRLQSGGRLTTDRQKPVESKKVGASVTKTISMAEPIPVRESVAHALPLSNLRT
jgi:hypothetical protein